jgi:REP-associated tyrosine transposase
MDRWVFHVLNRANARQPIFRKDEDYDAFERVLAAVQTRLRMRILAYCLMPNHWHLVLWPRHDDDLSTFMRLLTLTHTQRWHAHRGSTGSGHLYQGRFKSFVVQQDDYLLTVCRYVERNALRANLVKRAENWRWSSLWRYHQGDATARALLSDWPVDRPRNWVERVNQPDNDAELQRLRQAVNRGSPYGNTAWVRRAVTRLRLESTLRPRGRPRREDRGSHAKSEAGFEDKNGS